MTPQRLIEVFDTVAEAPGGTDRLRELVLQLAVRGKLVPQDAGDEPASVLLERIADERAQLIRAKQIRPQRQRDPIVCSRLKIPQGWKYLYLGDVIDLEYGKSLPLKDRKHVGDVPVYGSNGVVGKHDVALVNGPCIVVGRKGSAGIVNIVRKPCWPIDTTYFVRPYGGMSLKYTSLMLLAARLEELDRATAIPGLNREEAYLRETLLPPLTEQHRIIAKVDELMGLIDRLDAARSAREDRRTAGRDSALATLRNASTSEGVGTAWTRIVERIDDLFAAPTDLVPLREAVLQLAVRGKLVPQDADEEPANRLLESVIEEKAKLVKERKLRKRKSYGPILPDEVFFEIPRSWVWARLHDLAHDLGQKVPDETFSYIDVSAVDNKRGLTREVPVLDPSIAPSRARKLVSVGSVIYSTVRPYLLNVAVIEREYSPMPIASTAFAVLHPHSGMHSRLLFFWLRSPVFVDFVSSQMKGVAYPAINDSDLLRAPVPLPPTAEQHRIVARVDELMGLIDQLERHLSAKEEYHEALAAAVNPHRDVTGSDIDLEVAQTIPFPPSLCPMTT